MILIIITLSFMGGMPARGNGYETFKVQGSKFKVENSIPGTWNKAQELKSVEVPVRDNALKVLTEKCNVCHRRQNPGKVFTASNMDELAPAIYKQVFVKKRMPRGNTVKLTESDEKTLREWISIVGK